MNEEREKLIKRMEEAGSDKLAGWVNCKEVYYRDDQVKALAFMTIKEVNFQLQGRENKNDILIDISDDIFVELTPYLPYVCVSFPSNKPLPNIIVALKIHETNT